MILAPTKNHAARRQIEASVPDARALVSLPFPNVIAKLVSQLALAPAGSGRASVSNRASGGASVLGAQARPTRRDVKDITCFGCRKKGHYQKDCAMDPPAAPVAAEDASVAQLSATELAAFRRLLAGAASRVPLRPSLRLRGDGCGAGLNSAARVFAAAA
jgi:hypothetical protein